MDDDFFSKFNFRNYSVEILKLHVDSIEKSIDNAMKKVLGIDTPIYSLEPKVSKEDIFSSKNKTSESEVIVKDFDFSDL